MSIFCFSYQVAVVGFEPRPSDYQADVLPLDHPAPTIRRALRKSDWVAGKSEGISTSICGPNKEIWCKVI